MKISCEKFESHVNCQAICKVFYQQVIDVMIINMLMAMIIIMIMIIIKYERTWHWKHVGEPGLSEQTRHTYMCMNIMSKCHALNLYFTELNTVQKNPAQLHCCSGERPSFAFVYLSVLKMYLWT